MNSYLPDNFMFLFQFMILRYYADSVLVIFVKMVEVSEKFPGLKINWRKALIGGINVKDS